MNGDLEFIRRELDWDLESRIGYDWESLLPGLDIAEGGAQRDPGSRLVWETPSVSGVRHES